MARSKFDDLHDKYHAIRTTKAGTRYERLAAIVFKILEDKNIVIHDMKMVGDSSVSHQIDVTIEHDGKPRRIVIECKDFDVSGGKVGLDIVRSFRSVIEDTAVEEAIILTCNGYTRDALKFARAKNIKLVVLREVRNSDLEGLIREVNVQLHVQSNHDHSVDLMMSQENHDRFKLETGQSEIQGNVTSMDPVSFIRGDERVRFTEFLSQKVDQRPAERNNDGRFEVSISPEGWQLQVATGQPVSFDRIVISYRSRVETIPINVVSQRIAELIISGLGADDILMYGDQIERRKINPVNGEIA